jgi:ankyrin repeat protein
LYLLHLAAKFNNNRQVSVTTSSNSSIVDQTTDNVSDIIRREYDRNGCATFSSEKYSPVHIAAYYGHKAFIEYIIENDKDGHKYVTKTTNDRRKMNVLHICAEFGAPKTNDEEEEEEEDDDKKKKKKENDKKYMKAFIFYADLSALFVVTTNTVKYVNFYFHRLS